MLVRNSIELIGLIPQSDEGEAPNGAVFTPTYPVDRGVNETDYRRMALVATALQVIRHYCDSLSSCQRFGDHWYR
jgi:hypothetical protein